MTEFYLHPPAAGVVTAGEEAHGAGRLNGSLTDSFIDSGHLWLAA